MIYVLQLDKKKMIGYRFVALYSATTEPSDQVKKTEMRERMHKMLAWKTLIWEKTTAAHGLQNITMRGNTEMGHKDNDLSCSLASPHGGYNRGNNLFLSHTLSLCIQLRSIHIIQHPT